MTDREYVNGEITGKIVAISDIFKGPNNEECIKVTTNSNVTT